MSIECQANGKLSRIKTFVAKHSDTFTEPQLRWMLHNSASNGLSDSGAVIRRDLSGKGTRPTVWIDEDRFFAWLRGQNTRAAA
jgi:hypothetical protein